MGYWLMALILPLVLVVSGLVWPANPRGHFDPLVSRTIFLPRSFIEPIFHPFLSSALKKILAQGLKYYPGRFWWTMFPSETGFHPTPPQ